MSTVLNDREHPFYSYERDRVVSLEDFVEIKLSGASYDRGALEGAQAQADNLVAAFARLLKKLNLTEQDVAEIVNG